jgi:hypothetical protein
MVTSLMVHAIMASKADLPSVDDLPPRGRAGRFSNAAREVGGVREHRADRLIPSPLIGKTNSLVSNSVIASRSASSAV